MPLFKNMGNITILSTTDMLLLQRVGDIAPKIAVVFQFQVFSVKKYFLSKGAQDMPDTSRLLIRVSYLMRIVQNSVSLLRLISNILSI